MKNKVHSLANVIIFALILATSQQVFGFSGGISGYSGNPATNTGNSCALCHSGGTVPSINLSGPVVVQPGTVNNYTLTISGGQQNSGGLNISASSGTLISAVANTKLQAGEITHTARAAAIGGTVSWNFSWQAPTTLGSYTIYSAGLSTNADSNSTGDRVANSATTITVSNAAPQPPTAVIRAPLTAQVGATVSFDGSASYDPDGIINQYAWNFGDGKTASGAHAINSYSTAGVYTVTLTVTDSDNLTHTTFRDITVGGVMRPVANPGGPYTGTEGQPVSIDASLSTHITAIVRYIWDFGDGSPVATAVIPTISHTYAQPGSYTITLAVQDANNITGVASTVVVINAIVPPPTDGPTLYANNCAACHNPLATSTKLNRTATQIQAAITANAGNVMGTLSTLTPTQVQAIATALVSTTPPPTDGPTLYANNCASCHNPLATSTKLNRTATQIQSAINANAGGVMGTLSGLTSTQVQAIAAALVSTTPPPPTDGPTLYASNCAACHNPLATSTKLNRTATQIQAAITANAGGVMGTLSNLTPTQVQAIATALVSTTPPPPPPTDGPTLYANNCASCHGPLATSTKLNRTSTQIQVAITANAGGVMGALSSLTPTQVQAIADALVTTTPPPPPPTDGPALYASNCAACHNPLATSTKLNRTATQIQVAITANAGGVMGTLSSLTPAQVEAIATALVSVTPPPPPTDGVTLYTNNCAACHNPLATSTKLNRTATQIQAAINANAGNVMGTLSGLTSAQVQAIADALVTTAPPPTTGEGLYNSYCLVCHGPGGRGGQYESVRGESASSIASAIREERLMNSISLTSSQLQAIATYLSGATPPPPPTSGQTLYNTYCLACHGPGGRGGLYENVTGESASSIASAIREERLMNSISLTSSQIQNIADYLSGKGGGSTPPPPAPTDGPALYANSCAGCHGPLATSSKLNRTASQIQAAINANTGGMGGLSGLTPTNIQAIAVALAGGGGTPPPPTPATGATLYSNNCSGCHGPLATSSKLNRTATQIQTAINANTGGMGGLSSLTPTNVQAIADALAGGGTTPTPTTGEQRYISLCQSCHGFNGTGGSAKAIVGVSASQITNAVNAIGAMTSITLAGTDAVDIANFLISGGGAQPPPTTGVEIYAIKCAACHGSGGRGGSEEAVIGASLSKIQSAMLSVSVMQPIPLTNGEAQALATYLSSSSENGGND